MSDQPTAVVREVNGQLVLDDPEALGVIQAVEAHNRGIAKSNCQKLFDLNAERVAHFVGRIKARGDSIEDVLIVLLDVDDEHGGQLAEILMPGHDWDAIRARGELPVARGLAGRAGIQELVDSLEKAEGDVLRSIHDVPAVVVMTSGTQQVFRAVS